MTTEQPEDECPIEAVFSDDRIPCVLPRGHDGKHHFVLEDQAAPALAAAVAVPEQQIGIAVADTPAGPRLAVTITCLLPADAARSLADAIGQAAGSMSATGLTTAPSGLLLPGGTVTR